MDDAFGTERALANQVVQTLLGEAWTSQRKAEITQRMSEKGVDLIDHAQIGDYDLALWYFKKQEWYAVSFNSGQEDPNDFFSQTRTTRPQRVRWGEVASKLHEWVRQHGKLLISSVVPERIGQYRRILSHYFLIGDWNEYPGRGFFLLPD
jgi:hypothetical protein